MFVIGNPYRFWIFLRSVIYKLVLFREGQAYASEAAKAGFSFPKVTEETPRMIDICKNYSLSGNSDNLQIPIYIYTVFFVIDIETEDK